jgi:hypothetical protein
LANTKETDCEVIVKTSPASKSGVIVAVEAVVTALGFSLDPVILPLILKEPVNKKAHVEQREEVVRGKKRKDLLLGSEYKKKVKIPEKKAYLIPKILKIQEAPFLEGSRYENYFKDTPPDYSTDFGDIHTLKRSTIDSKSGYTKQAKAKPESESEGEEAAAKPPQSDGSQTSLSRAPLETEIEKYKEKNPVEEGKKEVAEQPKVKKFDISKFKSMRDKRFNEDLYQFNELMESLSELKPSDEYLFEETHQALLGAVKGMNENLNRKDKAQVDMVKDKMREYSAAIKKTISKEKPMEIGKEGLSILKKFEGKAAGTPTKELQQYAEDIERIKNTPEISFESTERTSVSQNAVEAPFKTLSGDQDIGNVRAIGFLGPSQSAAREEEVIPPPSERAKSLRRFVNFRWVYSTQNSSLGYDSPFQKIEDQENRRKFNQCYLPTNKLPQPETQQDLDKAKSFNTYPLVPQQSLVGMMQPASELSFKTSTNPNARKITIDEKQFADTKLYNFEPTQVNIKPTNPFSAMYGMEAIDQIKRNPNNDKNTLEFSSVMYDACPIERIKRKYNKNKIVA